MKLKFHTLDVFTNHRFSGNPLAVVLDADQLSTAQMQMITKEFNLSETTFVLKPENPLHTAKMRIFYPGGEMSFAGHPTLGTAVLLAELYKLDEVKFELKAGLTIVKILKTADQYSGIFTAPIVPFPVSWPLPQLEEIAHALGLSSDEIGFDGHAPIILEGGPRFFYVPVKSRKALETSAIREPFWSTLLTSLHGVDAAYIYTRSHEKEGWDFRARMYAPSGGIPEDPATGSATALLAAQLLISESLQDGTRQWHLLQGVEMGRPSNLRLEADISLGKLKAVRVGGNAVRLMSGEIEI